MCILYSHSTLQSHFITNYMANKGEMIIRISAILLLLLFRVGAQDGSASPPPGYMYPDFSPSLAVIVVVLISALFFMGFFSIYIRHCSDTSSVSTTVRNIGASIRGRTAARGLDKTILETFPTFGYSEVKDKKIGKGALECAVCLNEFEEEDTLRLIPKCDHVFHPECIDAWLESHVTCPVCRANLTEPVETVQNLEPNDQPGEVSIRIAEDQTEDVTITEPPQSRPKFPRSHTTGHLQVRSGENVDRFTLRLPEDFRKQVMTRALERTASCVVVLPRESSSRRGFRTAFGRSFKRVDPIAKSDRWVFSMRRSFFSRGPSMNSPKGEIGESSTSVRGTMKLPSFKCLEPKGDETSLMSGESSRPPV